MKNVIPTFLLALLTWCAPTAYAVGEVDRGVFDNREYRNESFGFSFTVPRSWEVQDPGELDKTVIDQWDAELDQFMSSYEEEKGIREGESPIYFGLFFSILPLLESSPASLTVYMIDLSRLQGVDGAEEYLRHFGSRFPEVESIRVGDVIPGEFGGHQFYAISVNAAGVRRMEYTTVVDEYGLVFSIIYEADEQLDEARRVLHGIRFDRNE